MAPTTITSAGRTNDRFRIDSISQERNEVLNSLSMIHPSIIGNVEKFNSLFGASNALSIINYSSQNTRKSKYDYVDVAYKFNNQHNVLLGPISFFGLFSSNEKTRVEDIEQSLKDGKIKLMVLISNFSSLKDPESAKLMTTIVRDLHAKMDCLMSNEKTLSQITEQFPKLDRTTYDRSKELNFERCTMGQSNLDDSSESVRLKISVSTCEPNNDGSSFTCYETVRGISRAKNWTHFYPPANRVGYLLLKMPHVRLAIRQSTEFSIRLHAKFVFVKRSENLKLPYCFDMRSGEIFEDSLKIDDLTSETLADDFSVEENSEGEESIEPENGISAVNANIDNNIVNDEANMGIAPTKGLSTIMMDCLKRHDAYGESLEPHQLQEFTNECISSLNMNKTNQVSLLRSNNRIVSNSRIPEFNAPEGSTLDSVVKDIHDRYEKYRLTNNVDDIIDECWNKVSQSRSVIDKKRERPIKPKKKYSKRRNY
ncbi:IVSP2-like protein [Lissonota sp. PSUC_FEM 10030012]|nr:IVSP2-like protein [Lissonota sp. PSUC_FEM 10030012]